VAVAFSVVAGAGLLLRSFWEANSLAIGIDTEHVISAEFAGGRDRYPGVMEMRDLLGEVRAELEADPTFLSTARIPWTPLASPHVHRDGYFVLGTDGAWHAAVGDGRGVDPSYFGTLGIDVVAGRGLTEADTAGAPGVVVVNETFYRRHMEGVASLGTRARACDPEVPCQDEARIVGVVEDVRINGAEYEVAPEVFIPLGQTDWYTSVLVARVTGSPEEALLKMVGAVQARDPEMAVRNAGSLEAFRRETVAPRRFMAGLLVAFALVTGGLALGGVFGVTALAVAARTREIGIRRALGASEGQAEALVLREGLGVVALGGAAGLALTLGTARLLEGLLYGVRPTDPWVLAAGAVLFLAAAGVACMIPARRIARIHVPETLSAP
jgi:putative ABC transport system permease protein